MSAALAISTRLARSLRSASGSSSSSISGRSFSRSWIFKPVVPCWPSMKILVLLVVMVFSLANSGPWGLADWRRRKNGKPPGPLQRLRSGAFLGARVLTPLGRAAASRPEGSGRHHGERIFHRRGSMSRYSVHDHFGSQPRSQHEPFRPSRRPVDAREAQDRSRDPEGGLRDPEGEPRRA